MTSNVVSVSDLLTIKTNRIAEKKFIVYPSPREVKFKRDNKVTTQKQGRGLLHNTLSMYG